MHIYRAYNDGLDYTNLHNMVELDTYQYETTSLPMLVVALSWEVDWAVLGAGDS